jgi:hypothetical protein
MREPLACDNSIVVEIVITHDQLHLEVKGSHKLWALKSRLEIPLEHITGVHSDPAPAMGWFQGMKIAGTDLPNVFRAGLFWQEGDKVFWDVRHPKKTIVVELEDETCAKLVVEVKDPAKAVAEISQALADYRAAKGAAALELEDSLRGNLMGSSPELSGEQRLKLQR